LTGRSPLIEWRTKVLESELGWTARLVALVLSTHMDRGGGSCFPSLTTLTRESGLSRRAVCYALDKIEQAGLVERVRGGRGRPTHYRATSARGALVGESQLVHDVHQVVHVVHRTSARGAPEDVQEGVHKDAHNYKPRKRADARSSRKGARAAGAHPDSNYLDDEGTA
jgi:DNA-binding MarR family transcriptional regulator